MKRLVGGDFLLDMSPIELELSVDGTTKTNITDNEVLGQLTDLKRFIGSPSMVKPIWCKLTNGATDELIVARGTLAVVDVGEFEICIPLDGYKLTISVEFTQMETEGHDTLDDWYIDTNDAKYILISDAQSIGSIEELPVFENIVDKDGHKRFIEGDITIETISGVTQTYGKWSLSGSHLMIVIAVTIAAAASLTDETNIAVINLPQWIKDKLVPLLATYVSFETAVGEDENWSAVSIPTAIRKSDDVVSLYKVGGTTTATAETYVRFQYDFLIDNGETPAP